MKKEMLQELEEERKIIQAINEQHKRARERARQQEQEQQKAREQQQKENKKEKVLYNTFIILSVVVFVVCVLFCGYVINLI